MELTGKTDPERMMMQMRLIAQRLQAEGRQDLILQALGVPMLEELQIEAARGRLSRLHITRDYRLFLTDYNNQEILLTPIHKAVYLLFLRHPEGLEFKLLTNHAEEFATLYRTIKPNIEQEQLKDAVARITSPLDNAINEKCSRIRATFMETLDSYTASYYIISSHRHRTFNSSNRVWYQRLKIITLPRELVVDDSGITHIP